MHGNGLLVLCGKLVDGGKHIVIDIEIIVAGIELDADAALAPKMPLKGRQELLNARSTHLRLPAVARDPDTVVKEIGIVRRELLHGEIAHDNAVDNPRRTAVAPQSCLRILVSRRTCDGIKILPSAIVQMGVNNLHRLLFFPQKDH